MARLNELARRAKRGDVVARDELLARIDRGLVQLARRYYGADYEDLTQEARLGALRALKVWNPEGGLSFWNYCALWVRGRCGAVVRSAAHYRSHLQHVGRDDVDGQENFRDEDVLENYVASDDGAGVEAIEAGIDSKRVQKHLRRMNWTDSFVIRSRMRGATLQEVGRGLGVSRERIRQLEPRILRKLQVRVHARAKKVARG